jgi:glycosyltransferase involved in cell wall biosynthesis
MLKRIIKKLLINKITWRVYNSLALLITQRIEGILMIELQPLIKEISTLNELREYLIKSDNFNNILLKRIGYSIRMELEKSLKISGEQTFKIWKNNAWEHSIKPNVSVVITLYNYSEYIKNCINSVLASYLKDIEIEIVVVDDASTDLGRNIIVENFTNAKIPIMVLEKKFNTGLGNSRNIGINNSRADYVFMLDADNLVYPTCLYKHYKHIYTNKADAAYAKIAVFNDNLDTAVGLVSNFEYDLKKLKIGNYIDAMACFKKDTLINLGGYSTDMIYDGWFGWEDYEMWVKLGYHGKKIIHIHEVLTMYRSHTTSMINTTNIFYKNLKKYIDNKYFNNL